MFIPVLADGPWNGGCRPAPQPCQALPFLSALRNISWVHSSQQTEPTGYLFSETLDSPEMTFVLETKQYRAVGGYHG